MLGHRPLLIFGKKYAISGRLITTYITVAQQVRTVLRSIFIRKLYEVYKQKKTYHLARVEQEIYLYVIENMNNSITKSKSQKKVKV